MFSVSFYSFLDLLDWDTKLYTCTQQQARLYVDSRKKEVGKQNVLVWMVATISGM